MHLLRPDVQQAWVRRRHDQITFETLERAAHEVSIEIDLSRLDGRDLPMWRRPRERSLLLPISHLRRDTRHAISLFDDTGAAVPLLTRDEERELVSTAVGAAVRRSVVEPDEWKQHCGELTEFLTEAPVIPFDDDDRWQTPLKLLETLGVDEASRPRLARVIAGMASLRLLVAVLPADAPTRHVLALRYDDEPKRRDSEHSLGKFVSWAAGAPSLSFQFVSQWGTAKSHHVEVVAPIGFELINVVPRYVRRTSLPNEDPDIWMPAANSSLAPDRTRLLSSAPRSQQACGPRVHLRLDEPSVESMGLVVEGTIGVPLHGLFRTALLSTLATAVVFAVLAVRLARIEPGLGAWRNVVDVGSSTTLLLVLPAFVGTLLFQHQEGDYTSALLFRARSWMMVVSIAMYTLAFGMAMQVQTDHLRTLLLTTVVAVALGVLLQGTQLVRYLFRYRNGRFSNAARRMAHVAPYVVLVPMSLWVPSPTPAIGYLLLGVSILWAIAAAWLTRPPQPLRFRALRFAALGALVAAARVVVVDVDGWAWTRTVVIVVLLLGIEAALALRTGFGATDRQVLSSITGGRLTVDEFGLASFNRPTSGPGSSGGIGDLLRPGHLVGEPIEAAPDLFRGGADDADDEDADGEVC